MRSAVGVIRGAVTFAVAGLAVAGLSAPPSAAQARPLVPSASSTSFVSSSSSSRLLPTKPRPRLASAGITSRLPSPRIDQDTTAIVAIRGASSASAVSVDWGDGAGRGSVRVPCTVTKAARRPGACTASFTHAYARSGTYPITVRDGRRVIARSTLVVRDAPSPWSPPAGWTQPAGWSTFGSATYVPCSTVLWHYDRATEPASAATMHADVVAGLAMLAAQTGLVFTETADPALARLTISWGDIDTEYPGAAAYGGRAGDDGFVVLSTTDDWPTDAWPGFGVVTQPFGAQSIGRGWLIVHETMHALGMGHVNDVTAVMNPLAGATAFNAGDLDGLHTMYLDNPCPV